MVVHDLAAEATAKIRHILKPEVHLIPFGPMSFSFRWPEWA